MAVAVFFQNMCLKAVTWCHSERGREEKVKKRKRETERDRERERQREKELGQLVIHYRSPIIHSGPTRLVLCCSPAFISALLLNLSVCLYLSLGRKPTVQYFRISIRAALPRTVKCSAVYNTHIPNYIEYDLNVTHKTKEQRTYQLNTG